MTALAHMRATEFKRLGDEVYVDHAGATLPSEKQLEDVFKVHSACLTKADLPFEAVEMHAHRL